MNIVVFDLDGVILKSPMRASNPELNYWQLYWEDLSQHIPNMEMLELINSLVKSSIHVFILTARPVSLLDVTLKSLRKVCHLVPRVCTNIPDYEFNPVRRHHLMMRSRDAEFGDFVANAVWKRKTIELLQVDHHVLFALEDYKPNADEMRKAAPVLLYEQFRSEPRGD